MKILITLTAAIVLGIAGIAGAQTTQTVKPYTLKTCIVSGQPLDDMGGPVTIVYKSEEIKFCCGQCKAKFLKSPDTYLPKIHAAEKVQ